MRWITLGKYINKYFQCYLNIVTYNLAVIRWEVKSLGMTAEWEFKHQHKQDTARTIANSPAAHSMAAWHSVNNICSCCSELGTWLWWLTDGLETKTSRRQFTIDRVTAGDEWQATVPILCAAGALHTQHTTPNWILKFKDFLMKYLLSKTWFKETNWWPMCLNISRPMQLEAGRAVFGQPRRVCYYGGSLLMIHAQLCSSQNR